MDEAADNAMWFIDSGAPGPSLCISVGVHGNERTPIEAGNRLLSMFSTDELALAEGSLLFVLGNPRAAAENQRWSANGVDLNRCFHPDVLARPPGLYEESRAREIAAMIAAKRVEILVDFHCTVEPGRRFLMHHPPAGEPRHAEVAGLLAAEVVLADPLLLFGGVSFDEHLSTRGGVGICYETGWLADPGNDPGSVRDEMINLLAGLGMLGGRSFKRHEQKRRLEMAGVLRLEAAGFRWRAGVGENLQELPAGTVLGAYLDGRQVALAEERTLIFPKKKPELMKVGGPLVYLAARS